MEIKTIFVATALLSPLNSLAEPPQKTIRPELLAQSYSCSPRRTCSQIRSCDEAYWYLDNCSWGGRLDRDNDGIPCESLC